MKNFSLPINICLLLALACCFSQRINAIAPTDSLSAPAGSPAVRYERVNVKTNLLYDLAAGMNLGVEVPLSSRLSLDISGVYNPFTFSDGVKWKNWLIQPELRLWTRRALNGHFLAAHLVGGEYNLNGVTLLYNAFPETRSHRFEGWGIGGGLAYGYRWTFNRHWAMEAEVGAGVIYSKYDKYRCGRCGERLSRGSKAYVGPTKLAFSLIYRFGTKDAEAIMAKAYPEPALPAPVEVHDTIVIRDTIYIAPPEAKPAEAALRLRAASTALRFSFGHDDSTINPLLGDNAAQIDSLARFIARYADDPSLRVREIEINAYASLEGSAAHNQLLSDRRAAAGSALISDMRPDLAPLIVSHGMGEDWDSPTFAGKEALMEIADPDAREAHLRAIAGGALFRTLSLTQLPRHRRLECVIRYTAAEPVVTTPDE